MISKRIQTLSSLIKPYKKIADIGCDHGYLIIEAFLNHNIEFAQAIDNKDGPLSSAINNVSKYHFSDNVQFNLSNGIEELDPGVEVIVVAGLGGNTIVEILTKNVENLRNVKRLILQPNRNQHDVRKWAQDYKWEIVDEIIIEENDLFYEIIVLERAKESVFYTEEELIFGPILKTKRCEVFIKKWAIEYQNIENLINRLNNRVNKVDALKKESVMIKEIIYENNQCY